MSSNSETKRTNTLVAAIDIGTTYSGYAFSFKDEYDKDPTKVTPNNAWRCGSYLSLKQPTCILCDPQGELDSFGYEAEDKYAELAETDEHHKWYFFQRFKRVLYEKQIKRGIEIKDVKGLVLPARKVLRMAIRYLTNHLLDRMEKADVKADDIHWILTAPAIWTDSAKCFLREAAIEAGINEKNLTIALEPEAAAMYCHLLPSDCFSSLGRFDDKKYMIIDLGGDTVDITVHEKQADGTIHEVYKGSRGACCGSQVHVEFIQIMITIFGDSVFQTFYVEDRRDYIYMCRNFEVKKRDIYIWELTAQLA